MPLPPGHTASPLRGQQTTVSVLAAQGRADEALIAFEQVLEAQTKVLGLKHPDTLKTAASIEHLKTNIRARDQ
jgi:hypothetical protein